MPKYKLLLLTLGMVIHCAGQETHVQFGLRDIIFLAQSQSNKFKVSETQREVSQYQFLTYKSDLKPRVSIYGNAPVYSKQFVAVIQPDGSTQYLPVQQNTSDIGLSLSQVLPFSGGQISLNTELSQFYDFQSKYTTYNGTPVFILLNQPVFGFNEIKWRKKIEPLKLEEARREYFLDLENIAQEVTKLYFDVIDAQSNIKIAHINFENSQANYQIENKRVMLGTTTEDRLLQLELQMLKSKQELDKAKYDYKVYSLALRTYIGKKGNEDLELVLPEVIPKLYLSVDLAIRYARLYRPEYVAFERKKKEAQRDVAQAKAEKQQINITASYGLNRAADDLHTIYSSPTNQQTFAINLNVPILDWGRRSARYNTARTLEKLIDYTNQLDDASIEQEITTLAGNIDLLEGNIELGRRTDSVAERRFSIAEQLFKVGKLTVTDLSLAQRERDDATRSYISALRDYWNSYYLLRRVTLYDFERQVPLISNGQVKTLK